MGETAQTFLENFTECCRVSCTRLAMRTGQDDAAYQAISQECRVL